MLKFCSAPWSTVHITLTGDLFFCLCPNWNKKGPVGNLLKNSLTEIMHSFAAEAFKNSIVDQTFQYCDKTQCPELYKLDSVENFDFLSQLPRLPTNLVVAIDKNCNLQCPSCRNEKYFNPTPNPAAQHILNLLINEYKDFDEPVYLAADGSGDVFASPVWLEFFARKDLPKCFRFNIATNGNLITKNLDMLESIRDQLHSVIVSLDAATPDTYKKVRGGNFELVLNGIRAMRQMGTRVHTSFVLQYQNYTEVDAYRKLAKSLDVETIGLHLMDEWHHMAPQWFQENHVITADINQKNLAKDLIAFKEDPQRSLDGGIEHLIEHYRLLSDLQESPP